MPKIIENLPQRLAEEARRQTREGGYGALTIRSVARGCGVGVGTVYNYYASKDALVAAFLLADWKEALQAIEEAARTAEAVDGVLLSIYENLTGFYTAHSCVFRDEAAAPAFAGAFSRYHGMLRSQLARPLRSFCPDGFTAEFAAEALLTWTVAGKSFREIQPLVKKLFI